MPCKEIIECQQGWSMFLWDIFHLVTVYTFHMILTTDNIWRNWISQFLVDFRTDEMQKIYLKKKPGEIFPVVYFPKWESEKIFIFHNYSNGFLRKTSANRGLITRVVLCYLYHMSVFPQYCSSASPYWATLSSPSRHQQSARSPSTQADRSGNSPAEL